MTMSIPFYLAQGGGLGDVIEGLIQVAVLALVFGLPMLEGLRKKRAGQQPAPKRAPEGRTSAERGGRDIWRELLEQATGEPKASTEAPPRPKAPAPGSSSTPTSGPPPVPSPAPSPAPRAVRTPKPASKPRPAPASRSGTRPAGSPPPIGARALPSAERKETLGGLSRTPTESELERSGPSFGGSTEDRLEAGGKVEREELVVMRDLAERTGDPSRPSVRAEGLFSSPDDLRRAIVASEVLGLPLALRGTHQSSAFER